MKLKSTSAPNGFCAAGDVGLNPKGPSLAALTACCINIIDHIHMVLIVPLTTFLPFCAVCENIIALLRCTNCSVQIKPAFDSAPFSDCSTEQTGQKKLPEYPRHFYSLFILHSTCSLNEPPVIRPRDETRLLVVTIRDLAH
jgi:hypothetical protein